MNYLEAGYLYFLQVPYWIRVVLLEMHSEPKWEIVLQVKVANITMVGQRKLR